MSRKIFISYAREDKEFCSQLQESLSAVGLDVWLDTANIKGGKNWSREIERAIESSDFVLVIWSPYAAKSDFVQNECLHAQEKGIQIIPIRYKHATLPIYLKNLQYIDFYEQSYERGLAKLLENLGLHKTLSWPENSKKNVFAQTRFRLRTWYRINSRLTKRYLIFVFIIIILFLMIVLGKYIRENVLYNLQPMSGDLNIAVVRFSEQGNSKICDIDNNLGLNLANKFYTRLDKDADFDEFYREMDIVVSTRGPLDLYELKGDTEEKLAISAQSLAEKVNAHVVVYGTLSCSSITQKPLYNLIFYVSPLSFGHAQELLGEFSFGTDLLYGAYSSGEDITEQNETLRNKIEIISLVMKSLGAFLGDNYSRSLKFLESAMQNSLWEQQNGLEVLYVLAGNSASRHALSLLEEKPDLAFSLIDIAEEYYWKANHITVGAEKGEYTRAYLGLAGVENFYAVAPARTSDNPTNFNENALYRQLEMIEKAVEAEFRPVTADVIEKAAFNRGQVYVAYYGLQKDREYLFEAEKQYKIVINAYKEGNKRITEIAAHSHSGLAYIAKERLDFDLAIEEYKHALELTQNPSLQAQYLMYIGNTYRLKENYEFAYEYYKEALARREDLQKRVSQSSIEDIERFIQEYEK